MILLGTMMLSPVLLAAAALIYWLAARLGWRLAEIPNRLGFAITASLCFGCFLGYAAIDDLVLTPATLQHRYLGHIIGTPFTLVRYQFSGFQDPNQTWIYRLSAAQAAELRNHCLTKGFESQPRGTCMLFSGMDQRWAASIEIKGDTLVMNDALW